MHVSVYNHDGKLTARTYMSPGEPRLPVLRVRDGDSEVTIWMNDRRGVLAIRDALDRLLDLLDAEEHTTAAPSQPVPRDLSASLASVTAKAIDRVLTPYVA